MTEKFKISELKYRRCFRAAEIMKDCFIEGNGLHSRLLEVLIPDQWASLGESTQGNQRREHVVPLAFIRDQSLEYFKKNESIELVAKFIADHYFILRISQEEALRLDRELGLKSKMPKDWKVGDSILARIHKAGIEIKTDSLTEAA